jgi:hypothetical protein
LLGDDDETTVGQLAVKAFNPVLYFGLVLVGILRLSGAISAGQDIALSAIVFLVAAVGMGSWEQRHPESPLLRELQEVGSNRALRRLWIASLAVSALLFMLWATGTLSPSAVRRSLLVFAIIHLVVMSVWFIGKFSSLDRGGRG